MFSRKKTKPAKRQDSESSNDGKTNGALNSSHMSATSTLRSSNSSSLSSSSTVVYRICIPAGIQPGEFFQVMAGPQVVRVKCPVDSRPGQWLQITLAADTLHNKAELPPVPDSDNVEKVPLDQLAPGEPQAYMVTIPEGVRPRTQFPVTIGGHPFMVTCPAMARPGSQVRIVPPVPDKATTNVRENGKSEGSERDTASSSMHQQQQRIVNPNRQNDKTQMFEVVVPNGVQPGQPFALLAGGVRVLVTCPKNASSGQKIRFQLPIGLVGRPNDGPKSKLAEIKLSYDKDGWTRTIRVTDMKFQWTRFDHQGGVDTRTRFDTERSAYVRKIEYFHDHVVDKKMRLGRVDLVTPEKGVVDSRVRSDTGEELVSYSDIASAQMKSYEDKIQWFQDTCAQLCVDWKEGHMRINVRRDYLLSDSLEAVMSLSCKELRKVWRFEFIGEAGIDAGGLAREWFQLVSAEIFDPNLGLWVMSATNQMCMMINPASELSHPEDHLVYFRFIGRVMGKALFDRQLVKGHMVKHLYKHMLGWPIMFNDLKDIDEEYYNNLKKLKEMGADVEYVGADFTVIEETMGMRNTVELIPDGATVDVTEDNLPEYIEACLKYRMLGRYQAQLNELLLGFFDVIPEPLLSIFDFQELELLLCGLPVIDMQDWQDNSEYSGAYDRLGQSHQVCVWFWEIVTEYDQEMKARLLQFVTGTSGVPARGFGTLQGIDGNIRKFNIHGVSLDTCVYPRSHTCFNRIDLPLYECRDELEEKLKVAITMASTGFDIE